MSRLLLDLLLLPVCVLGLLFDLLAWLFEAMADGLRSILPEDDR